MFRHAIHCALVVLLLAAGMSASQAQAQGPSPASLPTLLSTAFTYQGQINKDGRPVTALCNMAFRLYDAPSSGQELTTPITQTVPVKNGVFTVLLDFGNAVFDGWPRFLGISVRCPADIEFANLERKQLYAAPYALQAISSASVQQQPVSSAPPQQGQVLKWSGREWSPSADERGISFLTTVIVSPGATPAASGSLLAQALAGIIDASDARPYLLKIEPGVYQVSGPLQLKPWVDLEGSGEGVTRIQGNLLGADNVELRWLTLEGEGQVVRAVNTSPRLSHVTILATGDTAMGVFGQSSQIALQNARVEASGRTPIGIELSSSNATLRDVITVVSGTVQATGMWIQGSNPDVRNVSVSSQSAITATGVHVSYGGVEMSEAHVKVSAQSDATGVRVYKGQATLTRCTILSSGPASRGIQGYYPIVRIRSCQISASGGSANSYGVYNEGSSLYWIDIQDSRVSGQAATLKTIGGPIRAAQSELEGGGVSGAGIQCAAVVDENLAFYASTCP